MDIPKDWCMKMAAAEGDQEIGAGLLARDPGVPPLEWIKFLIEANPFPGGMTGEQWQRLSREIIGTIELAGKPQVHSR